MNDINLEKLRKKGETNSDNIKKLYQAHLYLGS